MNLLFMQNGLAPYGIPRSGLVSIIDPWRDTYGRNILPAGSDNFVTGWSTINSETITVTDYPTTININGVDTAVIAKRIQGTGNGSSTYKYKCSANFTTTFNNHYCTTLYAQVLSSNAQIKQAYGLGNINLTADMQKIESIADTTDAIIQITTSVSSNKLDILVYQPQVNLSTLYPYAPPSGLPQSTLDYSGHGNTFQLGSTAGSDTNDPAWSGNGLTFGTDDYCKSSSPAFDDMPQFTCITVFKAKTYGGGSNGRIWDKTNRSLYLYGLSTYRLFQVRSSASDAWDGTRINTTQNSICGIRYNALTPDISPIMYENATKLNVTHIASGTGAISSDASSDLYIGNRSTADRYFDGSFYIQLWYNRILSDAEYMQAYNGLRRLMSARGVVI